MSTRESKVDANEESGWSTVETLVIGTIAAEVRSKDNYVPGHPPLYSLRVGRARIAEDGTVWISPHMSIYDLHVACELVEKLGLKYRDLRGAQSSRLTVEQRRSPRSPRMQLTRDGTIDSIASRSLASSSGDGRRYYTDEDDED